VTKHLYAKLLSERVSNLPKETGGYLIGRRRGPHIEITNLTIQGPNDMATVRSFDRSDPGHALRAIEAWNSDSKQSGIVGDWHSHPIGTGIPSTQDERSWLILAKSEKAKVVGIIVYPESISVYLTKTKAFRCVTKCERLEETEQEIIYGARSRFGFKSRFC
jgi:integrative and conjugative element protein (TIGR02256 family)